MAAPSLLVDAIINLLDDHPSLAGIVWDGTRRTADGQPSLDGLPPPWVQVHADPGIRDHTSWCADSDLLDMTVTTVCVGGSARAARLVADWVVDVLLNARPSVAGWETWEIRQAGGSGAREDIDIPELWTCTPTWRVRATNAED